MSVVFEGVLLFFSLNEATVFTSPHLVLDLVDHVLPMQMSTLDAVWLFGSHRGGLRSLKLIHPYRPKYIIWPAGFSGF